MMQRVSLTVGRLLVVEELAITFTHTVAIDWLLPRMAPTTHRVEMGGVGIKDHKLTHEHIYGDQARILVQGGLLKKNGLLVCGAESTRRLLSPSLPARTF